MSEQLSSDAAAARFAHVTHLSSERGKCMRKMFLVLTVLITASLLIISCGDAGTGNTANKPANAANNATATAPANTAAAEADVKKLVNDTAAALAKNDVAALEKIYADNYMLVNLDGTVQNRAERLASFKSGETKFDSFSYDEINVRTNPEGTGAVVIARATAKGINRGKPMPDSSIRVTQVWSKTKDGWRQASGHATTITAAAPAKADDKKMDGDKPAAANTAQANK
ncbi:MAG: nuclear transport factor 2 family protein [Blastocatellia bacterium]